jgi:hypothetical protein
MGGFGGRARQLGLDAFIGALAIAAGSIFGALIGALVWLWSWVVVLVLVLGLNGRAGTDIDPEALTQSFLVWSIGLGAVLGAAIFVGRSIRLERQRTQKTEGVR